MSQSEPPATGSSLSDTDRINALERTTVSLEGSVSSLAETVKIQGRQMSEGFKKLDNNISELAQRVVNVRPGVTVTQVLIGVAATITTIGTLVVIFGAIVTGILFLAAGQSRDAAADAADPVEARVAEVEIAVAVLQRQAEMNSAGESSP